MVIEQFSRWRAAPPSWSGELYVPPEDYAQQAGWELSDDGQRRDLYSQQCYELKKGASTSPESFMAVKDRDNACPWCQTKLTTLFQFAPKAFDLGFKFDPTLCEVATCAVCSAYGTGFGAINETGQAQWSSKNVTPEYLSDDADEWDRLTAEQLNTKSVWARTSHGS